MVISAQYKDCADAAAGDGNAHRLSGCRRLVQSLAAFYFNRLPGVHSERWQKHWDTLGGDEA
eukprot:6199334-Pleurochrysis_carterae.AAC.2